MTANTAKGIPYPEVGVDYYVDTAQHVQDAVEHIDGLFDGYRPISVNGLTSVTEILEADTLPIGTAEAPVLTSDQFTLSEPTQVQITLSWDALTSTELATAQWRIRPGNIGATPVGGCRLNLPGTVPGDGGSITACPTLPAGTYTILATLQLSVGSAVVHASQEAPATLLVRALP